MNRNFDSMNHIAVTDQGTLKCQLAICRKAATKKVRDAWGNLIDVCDEHELTEKKRQSKCTSNN